MTALSLSLLTVPGSKLFPIWVARLHWPCSWLRWAYIYICPGKESSAHLSPNTFADKPERRQVTKCNCWCKDPRDTQMHSTNTGQAWKPLQRRDVTKAIQSTCFLFTFPSSLHEPKSPNIQCGAASASTFGFTLSWAPETAVNEGYAQRARIACCNLGSQDQ